MSAYRDALHIGSAERGKRLELAVDLLTQGKAVVVLDDGVAFRPESGALLCEVIADFGKDKYFYSRCIADAKLAVHSSTLWLAIEHMRQQWLVVSDYGTGTVELWRDS